MVDIRIYIRLYHSEDLEAVTALMHDLGYTSTVDRMRARMQMIQRMNDYFTYVAVLNGQVVGMIGLRQLYTYEEDGVFTQISLLVTKKGFEGLGIGTALVQYAEKWASEKNSKMLVLTSGMKPERMRAHEFYKARGFKVTGYRFVKKI